MLSPYRRLIVIPALIVALLIGFVAMSDGADAAEMYYRPPGGVYERVAADLVVSSTYQGYSRNGGHYTDAVVVKSGQYSSRLVLRQ